MSEERLTFRCEFDREFHFESYGVRIKIESDSQRLLDKARLTVENTFLGRALFLENETGSTAHAFGITHDGEHYFLYKNGEQVSYGKSETIFFKYLNGLLRIEVAEHTTSRIFVHAGVVGINGQAIVIPGRSFQGKTTLTAELIRNGAEYYSDEYAVLDKNGLVYPFPRKLSMRYFGSTREKDVTAEDLGGTCGHVPLPVGMVLITEYKRGSVWKPEILSSGNGIIEIVPHTIPIRQNAKFSLKVLDLVARRAIIVKSPRGDAKKFAKFLLAFFDNITNLGKMT